VKICRRDQKDTATSETCISYKGGLILKEVSYSFLNLCSEKNISTSRMITSVVFVSKERLARKTKSIPLGIL